VRVVPERVRLDRLALPRRQSGRRELPVHPRRGRAVAARAEEAVGRIGGDAGLRAARQRFERRLESREQHGEKTGIQRVLEVCAQRLNEPQRRIRRRGALVARRAGRHAAAQPLAEVFEHVAREPGAAGRQRQARQRQQRVACGIARRARVREQHRTGMGDAARRLGNAVRRGRHERLDPRRGVARRLRMLAPPRLEQAALVRVAPHVRRHDRERARDARGRVPCACSRRP
jgi:hypothetical protein